MRRFALVVLVLFFTLSSEGRQLYWDSLSVKARLEADGRLHVEETQTMVFSGDWNGGERIFNIRPRQELAFGGMSRIDANGTEIPMQSGSLDSVDNYDFTSANTLRWRARNPSDPEFDNTAITYVLRYALSNILQRDEDRYVLDHDFAFSDREGTINRFNLELTLDPAWQPSGPLQKSWSASAIPPGKSFVLRIPLRFTGEGTPMADDGLGDKPRRMLIALGVVPLLLLGYALLREKMIGRLDSVPPDQISRSWLQQHLLRERPEVIGAMWDEDVGAAEVSAALARMVGEQRLKSEVKGEEMKLEILTRKDLDEYEQALLDGLFFRGNHTSTSSIRAHYKDSGFNPAALMAPGLKKYVEERLPKGEPLKPSGIVPTALFFAAIAAFVWAVKQQGDLLMTAVFVVFGGLFVSVFTTIAPNYWRPRKSLGIVSALFAMLPAALVTGGVAFVVWRSAAIGSPELTMEMQLALTLLGLWIFSIAVHTLRSRESREAIAFLKMLGQAREFFRAELKKERPALDDAWYPYVLAFGLDDDVQRWFRAFPSASKSHDDDRWHSGSTSSSSSGSSSFAPSTWSGGGGAFGGAGASGIWAAAATGMAAGVAAPSSSGSSSGGSSSSSSSGGSSGGGGGGGW